jgi:hypothetical protein
LRPPVPGPLALWRIDGEAGTDGAGGELTLYALTSGESPDPVLALRSAACNWEWSEPPSVTRVGTAPAVWDADWLEGNLPALLAEDERRREEPARGPDA